MELKKYTNKELLQLQSSILNELKSRNVVRTQNNPLGDYTEWLVSKGLNLKLARNSATGYDAHDINGKKIQIKGRRITVTNKSRQLSAIRKLEERDFDELVAIIFDDNYDIIDALLIPHIVVKEYAIFKKHVNAHILHLKGQILTDTRCVDIKEYLDN